MKRIHMPRVDARYWLAITLASVFGTNLGDLYAHTSGLGLIPGVLVLVALAVVVFAVERADRSVHEAYYWLVIVIIRTGATNLADYLAFRVRVPIAALLVGLVAVIAVAGWRSGRSMSRSTANPAAGAGRLPDTGAGYWIAMLAAGVFGTVLGDVCSHAVGQGTAAVGLTLVLLAVFAARHVVDARGMGAYWLTVATARTAGTALGDWLAENQALRIGLPWSTFMTALVFIGVLLLWRRAAPRPAAAGR